MTSNLVASNLDYKPGLEPRLFFVFRFDHAFEDYIFMGGFSKRDEAEALAESLGGKEKHAGVVEQTMTDTINYMVTVRLGKLANVLEGWGIKVGQEPQTTQAMMQLGASELRHAVQRAVEHPIDFEKLARRVYECMAGARNVSEVKDKPDVGG